MRMLQKLAESIRILHGVLHVWPAGRMAMTEVQEVFESTGLWLALAGGPLWVPATVPADQ